MTNSNTFKHARPPYEVDNFPDLDESTYPLAQGKDCVFSEPQWSLVEKETQPEYEYFLTVRLGFGEVEIDDNSTWPPTPVPVDLPLAHYSERTGQNNLGDSEFLTSNPPELTDYKFYQVYTNKVEPMGLGFFLNMEINRPSIFPNFSYRDGDEEATYSQRPIDVYINDVLTEQPQFTLLWVYDWETQQRETTQISVYLKFGNDFGLVKGDVVKIGFVPR